MSRQKTVALVLAGGVGSRLHPLTQDRAKPAVPFGGKYRIIDFTLSNCFHSGIRRILVLTQYKSHSLQMHLRDGWSIFNPSIGEFVTPVPPQQRTGESWYAGTADAVFQNLYLLERSGADRVLILSGDHIYRMDYAAMIDFFLSRNADVVVACMKVPVGLASSFGVMAIDENRRIINFEEKPPTPKPIPDDSRHALASMGVYVFDRELLCRELRADHESLESSHDFGRDLLPKLVETHGVYAYTFGSAGGRVNADGYWRDVGTIDAYYEANMDLLQTKPPLDLFQPDWPIRTAEAQAPPARAVPGPSGRRAEVENVMFGSGSVVSGGSVWHSLLSRNVVIHERAFVKHSILLDGVHVGVGAKLKNCIIDKNVTVPAGETIGFDSQNDQQRFTVSDSGIVVVPRDYRFDGSSTNQITGGADETIAIDETVSIESAVPAPHLVDGAGARANSVDSNRDRFTSRRD